MDSDTPRILTLIGLGGWFAVGILIVGGILVAILEEWYAAPCKA